MSTAMTRLEPLLQPLARWPVALVLVLLAALPGFFSLPPVDRDEALFAQATAQMVASGDLIDIRVGEEARLNKPAGIYWLQAAVVAAAGTEGVIWVHRLVSLAGILAAAGGTWALARAATGRRDLALLAAVGLGVSLLAGGEARLAKTDAALLATVVWAQVIVAGAHLTAGRGAVPLLSAGRAAAFWALVAAGILLKGPIGPMALALLVAGLSVWRRDLALVRALRPGHGLALVAVLVGPWLVAIHLHTGGEVWRASLGRDLAAKVGAGQESHGAPPGSYLALLPLSLWPGVVAMVLAVPALWRRRGTPVVALIVAGAVPLWLVFEAVATKLIHYTLPAWPFLALAAAVGVGAAAGGTRRISAAVLMAGLAVFAPLVLAGALAWALAARGLPADPWLVPMAVAAAAVALAMARAMAGGAAVAAALAAGLASALLQGAVYPALARTPWLWPAVAIAEVAARHPGCPVLVAGYAEPSVLFLTRGAAREVTAEAALAPAQGCRIAVVEARALGALPPPEGARVVEGMNLGRGREVRLYLVAP
jgi:4-amino-4-deoxy-L-arabinose transferase-like glycosyltransferase